MVLVTEKVQEHGKNKKNIYKKTEEHHIMGYFTD